MTSLRGKRVLVFGLGINGGGLAVARYCARLGARVTVSDMKSRTQLGRSIRALNRYPITYVLGEHRIEDIDRNDIIFQNPGVPNASPFLVYARTHGSHITNEAAFFLEHCPCPVIGITGTRGKSTVTSLIYEMARRHYGEKRTFLTGNIAREGFLDVLPKLTKRSVVIAEFSSWQLEHLPAVRRSPHIAVITNVLADHLDRYTSFNAYARAKRHIIDFQKRTDVAILNRDNAVTRAFRRSVRGKVRLYSLHDSSVDAYWQRGKLIVKIDARTKRSLIDVGSLSPSLRAYTDNVLAAVVAAYAIRIPVDSIVAALRAYRGLPFRLQQIGSLGSAVVVNDSASTSPVAVERAVRALDGSIVLIAGGIDKSLSYAAVARLIVKRAIPVILLPGSGSDKLYTLLRKHQYRQVRRVVGLEDAIRWCLPLLKKVDYLLFSPGGSSFNLFKNEFHRGRVFNALMRKQRGFHAHR